MEKTNAVVTLRMAALRPSPALILAAVIGLGLIVGVGLASEARSLVLLVTLAPFVVVPLNLSPRRLFLIAASVSLVLLMTTPPWFDFSYLTGRITDERLTVRRILAVLQGLVLLPIAMRLIMKREARRVESLFAVEDLVVLGWLAFAALSLRHALDSTVPKTFVQTVFLATCFYGFARLRSVDGGEARTITRVILFAGAVLGASVVFEAVTHRGFGRPGTVNPFSLHVYQASGLLAWPTATAFVLLLVIPLSYLLWNGNGWRRLRAKAFTCALYVCLFLTFSRSALVGAIVGPAVVLVLSRRLTKMVSVALAVVLLVGIAYPWFSGSTWYQERVLEEGTARDRLTFLQEASRIIGSGNLSWIVFGIGYDNFRHFRMLDPSLWEKPSANYFERESYPTHNTHLTIFLEMGAIAFVLWAALHVLVIRKLYRSWKSTEGFHGRLAGALLVSIISFLVGANGHTMLPDYPPMALYWFMLGWIAHPSGPFSKAGSTQSALPSTVDDVPGL